MELHFIRINKVPDILTDMETGIELRFTREQIKIKNTDIDALREHAIGLAGRDLAHIYL